MTAVCSMVTPQTPDTPELVDAAREPAITAHAASSAPEEGRPPLPPPLVNIWESFVLDQAQRGRTEVHVMVPILISMLSERGVASLRPDEKRRRRLEGWRDVLKTELTKIAQAKPQADEGLQDGFRPLDVTASAPLNAKGEDSGNAVSYSNVLVFLQTELAAHKRAVLAQVSPTAAALQALNRQEEKMVRHRLQLMQRLSTYSADLLEMGQDVVRKFQASELERITVVSQDSESDVDAALASLMPPPIQVTYSTVFLTFWQMIERTLAPVTALEPPAVKAWRHRAVRAIVQAVGSLLQRSVR